MDKLEKRITKSQEKRIKNGTLTGSHIIVCRDGVCLLDKTFGKNAVDGDVLQNNAVYRIASMTKPITTAALLLEQESGRLDIFDYVSKYLDGFCSMTVIGKDGFVLPAKNKIKVYMLVSHCSGIDSMRLEGNGNPTPPSERNLQSVVGFAAGEPLLFEPGSSQQYNTVGFDVAARIIEKTSGLDFATYLQVNLFDKLGMKDTTFSPTEEQWNRTIAIHDRKNHKAIDLPSDRNSVIDGYPVTYYAAGCGLVSTAHDYMKFAEMLRNNGKTQDGIAVLSEASVRQMHTPVVDEKIMPGSQKWGLGVRVITDDKYILPRGSYGWSGKYGSHFWVDPVNGITAVYMKNSAFDGGAGCMTANEFENDVIHAMKI